MICDVSQSPVYRWDQSSAQLVFVQQLDSSLPMAVKHFAANGRHYLLIANQYDYAADSAQSAVSTVYRLDDMTGRFVFNQVMNTISVLSIL
jgi:hypothetical protein